MSTESRTNGTTPDEIEADIARQRDELASTVDALHAKLDVKTRAQDKAAELRDRATTDEGKPTAAGPGRGRCGRGGHRRVHRPAYPTFPLTPREGAPR